MLSLEWGGVLCEPTSPPTRLLMRGKTTALLTSALLEGEEDLTGELFRSTLALSLERGGVLYESTSPLTKPLTQGKQVLN